MIAGLTYYQIFWYFLIYSFIGWCVEVAYHGVTLGQVVNRGFLNGPFCPVYGFGALSIFAVGNLVSTEGTMTMSPLLLFAIGMALATLVELIAGWALDRIYHARWWDYSDKPLNLNGYICLEFSLIWGIGIVFVIRIVHPFLEHVSVESIPTKYGWWILAVLYAGLLADFIVTVAVLKGMNRRLSELDDIRKSMRIVSDGLSEAIGSTSIKTAVSVQETRVQVALGKAELIDAAQNKKAETIEAINITKAEAAAKVDAAKNVIGNAADATRTAMDATRTAMEEGKAEVQRQMEERKALLEAKTKELSSGIYRRVFNAFPTLKSDRYQETLEKIREYMQTK